MSWAKFSDDYADDCWTLSDAAFRLHAEGIIWSNRKLLDMRIPNDDLCRFKRPEAVHELLEAGFWSDRGTHFEILHHSEYQRTREAVIATQTRSRTNGAKGGRPKKREVWQGNKTQQATSTETRQLTQPVSEVSSTTEPENSKNRGNKGSGNPAANLIANPKGQEAFNRSSSSEASLETDSWSEPCASQGSLSPMPRDPEALRRRQKIEENGIRSVEELMSFQSMTRAQAEKIWASAYPGGAVV
ncbi:hypothetical protein AHiyo8_49050 [Arthrobacter sp. Hiyo8]|uniref:hypothetical protein n=1 Tax=Arthrobacter sp. Hiyo1 TaxID=1588020 RepID=UPI0006839D8D|nr:hypothetical protein [Arthrobacter sp. Hiyo1]BAS16602.1 hypothetical protein AHiyo8_49050 [Arthrobacter sp. Hiyo8]GAP57330.1 hypothetical protein AHiyo1_01620 [Arthrobacter sp. Hiyo1]